MTRLIDEEEAFNVLSEYYKHRYYEQDEALLDALSRVPTAQPKRGKWIKTDSQQYFRKHYPAFTCSECGQRKDSQKTWNYCPNCGARMDEK